MPWGSHLMRASNGAADEDVKSILDLLKSELNAVLR